MVEENTCPHCGAILVEGACPNCGQIDVSMAGWLEYIGVSENDGFARGIIETEDKKRINMENLMERGNGGLPGQIGVMSV